MWPLPILIICLIAVVIYWPFLFELVERQIVPDVQLETKQADRKSTQVPKKTYEERPSVPVSMLGQPQAPSNIGTRSSSINSNPVPSAAEIDLKSAVEAISMDGIYIEQLQETADDLTIIGHADDNKKIANFLRQLQQKIGNPLLNMTKREELQGKVVSKFSIRLRK